MWLKVAYNTSFYYKQFLKLLQTFMWWQKWIMLFWQYNLICISLSLLAAAGDLQNLLSGLDLEEVTREWWSTIAVIAAYANDIMTVIHLLYKLYILQAMRSVQRGNHGKLGYSVLVFQHVTQYIASFTLSGSEKCRVHFNLSHSTVWQTTVSGTWALNVLPTICTIQVIILYPWSSHQKQCQGIGKDAYIFTMMCACCSVSTAIVGLACEQTE